MKSTNDFKLKTVHLIVVIALNTGNFHEVERMLKNNPAPR